MQQDSKKIKSQLALENGLKNSSYSLYQKTKTNDTLILLISDTINIGVNSYKSYPSIKFTTECINQFGKLKLERYSKYAENSSPLGWLINYPLRKNINVTNLEFIKSRKNYQFSIEIIDHQFNKLNFINDENYNGYIVYDRKTFNPRQINYNISKPRNFGHVSYQNARKYPDFEAKWLYVKECVNIEFVLNKTILTLHKLEINETLKDYNYKKFDKKGTILFEEINQFVSETKIKQI